MASIASTVARIKDDPDRFIPASIIHDACARCGHGWRERLLGPVVTVRLMILQVLFGNLSCRGLTRVAGLRVSAAGYCKARRRLPLDVLGLVMTAIHGEAVGRCNSHAASSPSIRRPLHNFRGNFRGASGGRWRSSMAAACRCPTPRNFKRPSANRGDHFRGSASR